MGRLIAIPLSTPPETGLVFGDEVLVSGGAVFGADDLSGDGADAALDEVVESGRAVFVTGALSVELGVVTLEEAFGGGVRLGAVSLGLTGTLSLFGIVSSTVTTARTLLSLSVSSPESAGPTRLLRAGTLPEVLTESTLAGFGETVSVVDLVLWTDSI